MLADGPALASADEYPVVASIGNQDRAGGDSRRVNQVKALRERRASGFQSSVPAAPPARVTAPPLNAEAEETARRYR